LARLAAYRGDPPAIDQNLCRESRLAGSVNDGAAANDDVVDGWTLPLPVAVLTLTGSLIFRDERLVRTDDREDPPVPPLASVKKPYDNDRGWVLGVCSPLSKACRPVFCERMPSCDEHMLVTPYLISMTTPESRRLLVEGATTSWFQVISESSITYSERAEPA